MEVKFLSVLMMVKVGKRIFLFLKIYIMKKITFVGLGVIGFPVAGHLANKGYNVVVHNRTLAKSEQWLKNYNGKIALTAKEAAKDSDVFILCVGDDNDIRDVLFSKFGAFSALKKGSLIIDHTTASAGIAKEISVEAKKKGIGFLDAPVSGGGIGAQNGALSIMVGGEKDDFRLGLPIMECYGKSINLIGEAGCGQLAKMANQILISSALQGVAEAIHFCKKLNLDTEKVLSVVSKGAAQSWQLENRGPWMIEKKYVNGGFTVDLIKKDLELVVEEANSQGIHLPITYMVDLFFSKLQLLKKGNQDFSSLIELL